MNTDKTKHTNYMYMYVNVYVDTCITKSTDYFNSLLNMSSHSSVKENGTCKHNLTQYSTTHSFKRINKHTHTL